MFLFSNVLLGVNVYSSGLLGLDSSNVLLITESLLVYDAKFEVLGDYVLSSILWVLSNRSLEALVVLSLSRRLMIWLSSYFWSDYLRTNFCIYYGVASWAS